jgi:peptidoglycan/LPS O-acetylase OafA/YrhL
LNGPADQGRQYVASLTGLRGIAALGVFVFHYGYFNPGIRLDLTVPVIGHALQFPLGFGFAGVDLFFVLSGFLLALPFARATLTGSAHQPLRHYYKRRLLRVFPAYYAQLLIILAVGAWFITWRPLDGASLLAHLFMFFNIGPEPIRPVVGVWWTLPVELSFYLLLPFIASFMRPGRWLAFLLGGVLLSMLYRIWCADHFAAAPEGTIFLAAVHLPGALPEFLLGASAAVLVQWLELNSNKRPDARVLDGLFLTGVVLANVWFWKIMLPYGGVFWSGHWSMVIAPLALGLPLSLIVFSLYRGSRIGRLLFANPVVYFIGLISYSLYLWHFVVLQQAERVFGETYTSMQGFPKFLFSLSLVLLVSTVSYYVFERPFFRLGARRTPPLERD